MSHTEFLDLHAASEALMRTYFVEVEKSSSMLTECTAEPLPPEAAHDADGSGHYRA